MVDLESLKYLIPGTIEEVEKELADLKQRKEILDAQKSADNSQTYFVPTNREQKILDLLHPKVSTMTLATLQEATAKGLFVILFCGGRTFEEQAALYKEGRDENGNIIDIKKIVTRAKPGYSWHNYFLAVDIVMNIGTRIQIHPTWNSFIDANKDGVNDWQTLGAISKSYGFDWGGDFKTLIDVPHQEYHKGLVNVEEALAIYNQGGLEAVWKKII